MSRLAMMPALMDEQCNRIHEVGVDMLEKVAILVPHSDILAKYAFRSPSWECQMN